MAVTTLISPGVEVKEIDKTASLGAVALGGGAIAGHFRWGPANEIVVVNSEAELIKTFGKPDSLGEVNWLTAASYLAYVSGLQVVRSVGSGATNSVSPGAVSSAFLNYTDYNDATYAPGDNLESFAIARYPGEYGDNITVHICDQTNFATWGYKGAFSAAPGKSANALGSGASTKYDCIHVIVIDSEGGITGVKGTVLEKFASVSIRTDATDDFGASNYIKDRIRDEGQWIYFGGLNIHEDASSSTDTQSIISDEWVTESTESVTAAETDAITPLTSTDGIDFKLGSGKSATTAADANATLARETAYDVFADADTTDAGFFIGGDSSASNHANVKINSITSSRKDSFGFISPPSTASSVNLLSSSVKLSDKADALVTWSATHGVATSFIVVDSGYKKMYNKYTDKYVAVPLNGDIAGISALTRINQDAWWSPAGTVRGQIRNLAGLYFNPGQLERDKLYPVGINPVISMPGQGTLLYGDKTSQLGTGAFTRINVRGLFIVLEKTIGNFAKSLLFEFNDDFTRSTFKSLVTSYLDSVQGKRGITDFRVICDETNNTGDVIDANEFVGDIFIKPTRSINFIRLNFVAVRTAVSFSEVIG